MIHLICWGVTGYNFWKKKVYLSLKIDFVSLPGRLGQSVTCLATAASLTADPWVVSLIPAWSLSFVEVDHEIISTVILFPSAESFKKGCCQLQAKVPGCIAQSGTCLATDACLTADLGVASSIPARSHTFVEIDHEILSTVILLPSTEWFIQEGLLSVTSESMCTNYRLTACSSLPRKKCD